MSVKIFALHNKHAVQVATATVSEAGATYETEAVRRMHNPDIPREQGADLVDFQAVAIADSVNDLLYLYMIRTKKEVTGTLSDMFSSLYSWDSHTTLHLPTTSGSSQGHHRSKPGSEDEITKDLHPAMPVNSGRLIAVRGVNLNNYSYQEVWLTVYQVSDHLTLYVMHMPPTACLCCSHFTFISSTPPRNRDNIVQLHR